MALIGRQLSSGAFIKLDNISSQFDSNKTTFNLTHGGVAFFPENPFTLIVSLGGVVKEPNDEYLIDENEIIFATPPSPGQKIFIVVLSTVTSIAAQPFKSLIIGARSGAHSIDLKGKNFAVQDRAGAFYNIAFNVS